MRITFFGIMWLMITLAICLKGKMKDMITLLFVAMTFQQPSVIMFGDTGIGPQAINSIIYVFFNLIKSSGHFRYDKFNKIRKGSCLGCILLIVCIIVSFFLNKSNTVFDRWILAFILLLVYISCFYFMWNKNYITSRNDIKRSILTTIKVVSVIGIIQFINTAGIINISGMLKIIFYNDTSMSLRLGESFYPWSMPRLYATFQEPSYCSAFLVGAFYFMISYKEKSKTYFCWIFLVLAEIMLSFSSTAYGAFAVCGFFYLIMSKNKKALRVLVPIAVVGILLLIVSGQFIKILNDVIFIKLDTTKSGSAWERNSWNVKALEAFAASPILGIGYKNCRGSMFLYSILGQLGIIGAVSWGMTWIPSILHALRNRDDEDSVAIALFVFGVIFTMLIAIPDVDFCVFWLAMYLMALCSNKYGKSIGK